MIYERSKKFNYGPINSSDIRNRKKKQQNNFEVKTFNLIHLNIRGKESLKLLLKIHETLNK